MSSSRKRSAKNSVPGKTTQSVPELKAPTRPLSSVPEVQPQTDAVASGHTDTHPTDLDQMPTDASSVGSPPPVPPDQPEPEMTIPVPTESTPITPTPATSTRSDDADLRPNPGAEAESTATTTTGVLTPPRLQPIPPPSEPMQYRAIGLMRGRYIPGEEQLTQGVLQLAGDSQTLPAVLLGRVMSLVKNHLNLERDYLWVVYPRVLGKPRTPDTLCFQIVGVWEPALLNRLDSGDGDASAETLAELYPEPENGYFSIRGEVIGFSEENQEVTVNIRQLPRKPHTEGKSFKLPMKGTLTGKVLGHFWDLDVVHDSGSLRIRSGACIGFVAPKKRSAQAVPGKSGQRKKPQPSSGANPPTPRPVSDRPSEAIVRREPLGKPVKKPRPE